MFFITHIDKFFHNSPGAEMCLGTPHFIPLYQLIYPDLPGSDKVSIPWKIPHKPDLTPPAPPYHSSP